jgi:hypothetical protein
MFLRQEFRGTLGSRKWSTDQTFVNVETSARSIARAVAFVVALNLSSFRKPGRSILRFGKRIMPLVAIRPRSRKVSDLALIHEDLNVYPCKSCRGRAHFGWVRYRKYKCPTCGNSLDDRLIRRIEVRTLKTCGTDSTREGGGRK